MDSARTSWQARRRVHTTPAPRLWCSELAKWPKSAVISLSTTGSNLLHWFIGRDNSAGFLRRLARRGARASWQARHRVHTAPAPHLWCSELVKWPESAVISLPTTSSDLLHQPDLPPRVS